jgi:hypothetical protein
MLGDFQYGNISTAIATVKELDQFKVNQSHIITALSKIKLKVGFKNFEWQIKKLYFQ